MDSAKICAMCHTPAPLNGAFCRNCGIQFPKSEQESSVKHAAPRALAMEEGTSGNFMYAIFAFGAILLVAVTFLIK